VADYLDELGARMDRLPAAADVMDTEEAMELPA
jgi:hypothetical protein